VGVKSRNTVPMEYTISCQYTRVHEATHRNTRADYAMSSSIFASKAKDIILAGEIVASVIPPLPPQVKVRESRGMDRDCTENRKHATIP